MAWAAGIGILSKAGSAYTDYRSTNSALESIMGGLNRVKGVDIEDVSKLGSQGDIDKFKAGIDTQHEYDPQFGALRDTGASNYLDALNQDASGNTIADRSVAELDRETTASKEASEGVIQGILDDAKTALSQGATLPPEYQAELVRMGLAKAGQSGENLDGSAGAGARARTLVGSAGVALQQSRANQAREDANVAGSLQSQRASILEGLTSLDNNLRGAKVLRAGGAVALGNGSMPSVGLTGADKVNLSIRNTDLQNSITMQKAGVSAAKSLNEGKLWSEELGAGSSALSGLMGGMGGGTAVGGGAATNAGTTSVMSSTGGLGSWIGGLFGGGAPKG